MKSCQGDVIIDQGKHSASLGNGPKMNASLFSKSGLAGWKPAKPNFEKREVGCELALTQGGSRCAPLPWAIIRLPLRGAGKANQIAGADGGVPGVCGFAWRRDVRAGHAAAQLTSVSCVPMHLALDRIKRIEKLCEQCSESFSQIRPSESENSEKTLFRFGDSTSYLLIDNRPQPHSTSADESTVLPQLIALNRVESCWSALKKIYFAVEKSANFAQPTAMRRISEKI